MPAGNPLANAIMLVVAALAVGAAIVLGLFAFIVLSGIVLVLAAIAGLRLWWFGRQLRKQASTDPSPGGRQEPSGRVIEGEYTVISTKPGSRSRD